MNQALFRLAVVICLVAAGGLCFHRFACDMPSAEDAGPHPRPVTLGEYLEGLALSTDLQARLESTQRRVQARDAVVTELLAGRLTLLEAAARFGELNAGMPETRDRVMRAYPGAPYRVALCRQVIEQARSVLLVRAPEQVERVVARLEAELQAHMECEAGLRLP